LGMGTGNTLESLLGVYLLREIARFRESLDRLRDVLGLVVLAAVGSTLVSATLGVGSGLLGGVIAPSDAARAWRTWWLGDMLADLVLAPLLFVWLCRPLPSLSVKQRAEAAVLLVVLIVAGLVIFFELSSSPLSEHPYFLFPLLIWAAVRFGLRGAV